MSVFIRERKGSRGYNYLYLDCYNDGRRNYKSLKLKVFSKPRTQEQKKHNKDMKLRAEHIRIEEEKNIYMHGYAYLDENRKKTNFFDYAIELIDRKNKATQNTYISALKKLVEYNRGCDHLKFEQITPSFLKGFRDYLLSNCQQQNTANSYLGKVGCILKEAMKDEYIFSNPMERVDKIKAVMPTKEFLTMNEVQQLADTACEDPLLKRAFLFSCFTGLRVGDAFNIRWKNVSSDNVLSFFPQKTPEKQVRQQLHPTALAMMGNREDSNNLIFPMVYDGRVSKKLSQWVKDAGIDKKITYHNSRHTFATLALTYHENIYAVKDALAHSSVQTTEIYAHLVDSQRTQMIDSIPALKIHKTTNNK